MSGQSRRQKMYQNVPLTQKSRTTLLKISVDEQKTMNEAKNHARSAIISSGMSVETTVSHVERDK